MANKTTIEWTDATWNPITGCSVTSPGCTNCYAMRLAGTRLRHLPSRKGLTIDSKAGPVWISDVRFNEESLTLPLQWKRPRKIFVCAHGDLFHDSVPDEWIDRVFAIMTLCPQHTFQVLTKRLPRMREYCSSIQKDCRWMRMEQVAMDLGYEPRGVNDCGFDWISNRQFLPNVWLGASIEDQRRADERREPMHALANIGWLTWVSYEPAIGAVDWAGWEFVRWIVSGGESGPGARPSLPDWHRSTRDFCAAHRIAFLFKQWGAWGTAAVNMGTGLPVFRQFPDFQTWVNKAQTWVNGGICIDRHGRELKIGADFMRARDEGSFPVTIMHRVGKKAAGRLLDGIEHNAYPTSARPT